VSTRTSRFPCQVIAFMEAGYPAPMPQLAGRPPSEPSGGFARDYLSSAWVAGQ
jgi:hypothetical protein